jgi:AraC-like DNA-binding protein
VRWVFLKNQELGKRAKEFHRHERKTSANGLRMFRTPGSRNFCKTKSVTIWSDRSRQLLTTTRLSIAEVAERAGFSSGEYLCVAFKKQARSEFSALHREVMDQIAAKA